MEQPFNPRARTIQCPTDLIVGTKYVIFRLFFGQNLISYYAFGAAAPKTIRSSQRFRQYQEAFDTYKNADTERHLPPTLGAPQAPTPPAGGSGPGVPL